MTQQKHPTTLKTCAAEGCAIILGRRNRSGYCLKHNAARLAASNWANPKIRRRQIRAIRKAMARPEVRAKTSRSLKARWSDPVVHAQLSKSQRDYWASHPDERQSRAETIKRAVAGPRVRARHRRSIKKFYATPEKRQLLSERMKKYHARLRAGVTPAASGNGTKLRAKRGRPSKTDLFARADVLNVAGRKWPQIAEILLPDDSRKDRKGTAEAIRQGVRRAQGFEAYKIRTSFCTPVRNSIFNKIPYKNPS